jgi:hydroxymethylbilane synthase
VRVRRFRHHHSLPITHASILSTHETRTVPSSAPLLRIGTRGSPLALAQAREVQRRLSAALGVAPEAIDIRVITTTGDTIQNRPLVDIGGKGLFTKEIEQALIDDVIDVAVHSAKDIPAVLPDGLVLACCLPREDARDAFISRTAATFAALPPGAVVGTASPRRAAMVKRLRRDLDVVPLRGNVETRLRKLDAGECAATLLAMAGLNRLGLAAAATAPLDLDDFVPAVGQGVIALETRAADEKTRERLAAIGDTAAATALLAERAFLAVLDGSCRTPIAGHARIAAGALAFRGLIAKPDGSASFDTTRHGAVADAEALGRDAGHELRGRAGADFFTV